MNKKIIKKDQILIVDDSSSVLTFFKGILKEKYNVVYAESGEKALNILKGPIKPDIILLDVIMPGMNGFDVCVKIKMQEETKNIPVIFITGSSSHDEETKGFDVGCVDFIPKPPNPITVLARIETHLQLAQANRFLTQQNLGLQVDLDFVRNAQKIIDYERQIVETILNKMRATSLFNHKNVRFLEQPLETATGDILMSCNRPSGVRHILLGDFTGHGLSAALAGPMVSDIFYQMTLKGCSSDQILIELNRKLVEKLPADMYMAGTLIEVNPKTNNCTIWNGALPNVLVFNDNKLIQELNSHNLPLGVIGGDGFDPNSINVLLGKKTHIFAYSDGITEITNQNNEMFGCERLISAIETMLSKNLTLEYLLEQAKEFQGKGINDLADDITIVEVICDKSEN